MSNHLVYNSGGQLDYAGGNDGGKLTSCSKCNQFLCKCEKEKPNPKYLEFMEKNKLKGTAFIKIKKTILSCTDVKQLEPARKMVKLWRESGKSTPELYLEIFLIFIGKENQLTIKTK